MEALLTDPILDPVHMRLVGIADRMSGVTCPNTTHDLYAKRLRETAKYSAVSARSELVKCTWQDVIFSDEAKSQIVKCLVDARRKVVVQFWRRILRSKSGVV